MFWTFEVNFTIYKFLLTIHLLFGSVIICSTLVLRWFLSFFLAFPLFLVLVSFSFLWLDTIVFCFRFPQNSQLITFLNSITTCVTINWHYKICRKFPRPFPGASLNILSWICSVFTPFRSNFLLALQWLLWFEEIDPTCFCSSIFEWLAFQYIRR